MASRGPFCILIRKVDRARQPPYWQLWRDDQASVEAAVALVNANRGKGITAWWWWGPADEADRLVAGHAVKDKKWAP